ncbi:MAG: penicillin-binding transpeptidase domain-containing protein [Succinivibrio sp.]|nr:peptidoglycan glycosyltransferase FtsI [Succinivibrio sp.]MDY3107196.1 penicillin-binding transpeptidase domain-containing protein [Succinivibrio sp.]MDY4993669.1 penicillin-binding transpeptidase domain-containing protein [Succinivibrio sp.]MDY5734375.1 penicillin-binding transpeptidase domain-containing protein [Succinivibrio sp.]MDY5904588.1 penicillin-binding transpeptidase domain-containing protein [Succinivibrio sp.]
MALISDSKGTGRLQLSMTRIVIVWFFLIATTAVIVSRLLWIQVLHPEKLIAEGNMRVLRSYHYEPPRGLITDRNGRILAISIPVKTVIADPKRLAEEGFYNDPKNIEKVSAILEIKKDVLVKKIENRTKRYALLKNYLDPEKAKALKAISKKGFILEDTYLRRYPTGEANASLVGIINGDGVGVYGVEQSFNSYLTSTKTTNLARKDIYNHIFENIATVKQGTAGGNLILSIDNRLQNYAYQSLKKVVEENEADSGSAVLIDVISGEVLAMVNAPSFDPNNRKTFDSSNAKNRAVTDIFEPGSTMKPIVALSALEAKTTNWSEVFDTRPFIVDGKMVRDSHAMTQGTILDIIKYSSNTGMAHISMRTGPQKILSTLQDFGFGTKTQSGLVGESSGKLNEHRAFWSEIDKATLGFGYGIAVTNLQLSSAYATLANGGLKVPVSILRLSKLPTPTLVASPKQVALMKQALETVVSDGTGGKAAIDRYRVAGKTGTAKIASVGGYGKYYMSTFAGFAPLSKPRFALVVNVNAPKAGKFYGGVVSGPVFREVMSRALQLYNIKPDKQL